MPICVDGRSRSHFISWVGDWVGARSGDMAFLIYMWGVICWLNYVILIDGWRMIYVPGRLVTSPYINIILFNWKRISNLNH
jgi:hypothetical protein